MKSRAIYKFYEPLVLLKALNLEMLDTAAYVNPGRPDDFQDLQDLFQTFVYKLAHVCDNVKGNEGCTITSVTVLQGESNGSIEYWLASNQRTEQKLEATASFVRSLLQHAKEAPMPPCERTQAKQKLLREVLSFNRERVTFYLQSFRAEAQKCIDKQSTMGTTDGKVLFLAQSWAGAYSGA